MRILLVEDHVDSAIMTQRLLQSSGYIVQIARDSVEARSMCAQQQFNLLLCDLGLPDGDGWTLMRELHKRYGLVGVALSGHACSTDAVKSADAGFVAHVNKPFDFNELLDVVANAIAQRPLSHENHELR